MSRRWTSQSLKALQHVCFYLATDQLSGAVPLPVAGPLAAWMPPRNLKGRIRGVSRKWRGHRALDSPNF
ncbi:hypothetical protein XarjCFBP7645_10345 [Xanthomonas arboricola]|uniref:Uncharacterized protein n=1 Tax=Xanthomonas arboricola TaxID=56448 RepID=A0A2S7AFN0_9XANT|nr:hypothetical protein XarjCFBP7645_10345 [Xanthomonas arboricola]